MDNFERVPGCRSGKWRGISAATGLMPNAERQGMIIIFDGFGDDGFSPQPPPRAETSFAPDPFWASDRRACKHSFTEALQLIDRKKRQEEQDALPKTQPVMPMDGRTFAEVLRLYGGPAVQIGRKADAPARLPGRIRIPF